MWCEPNATKTEPDTQDWTRRAFEGLHRSRGARPVRLRGVAKDKVIADGVDFSARADPAYYAGEVTFRIAGTISAGDRDLPFHLFLGLARETETRLAANVLLDLRQLQSALPDLLTGPLDPSCGLGLDLRFDGLEADGTAVTAQASVDARIYRCKRRGTEGDRRGIRLFTQTIDVDAVLSAELASECISFRLVELDMRPKGVLGGLATLFGVTDRARAAILREARMKLAENPVCPDLPPALAPSIQASRRPACRRSAMAVSGRRRRARWT